MIAPAMLVILGLFGAVDAPWKYLTLLGLIPVGTALTGNCPLYTVLGIDTRGRKPRPTH